MNNNQNYKKRVKTALDQSDFRLYGQRIGESKDAPNLLWYITEAGKPRIDVYTGVDGDVDNGRIRAAMDFRTAGAVLELIDKVASSDSPCRYYITNRNYIFPGGVRSEKPVETCKTVVGRAEDGRVYISLIAKDRPKAVFYFTSPYFHDFTDSEGNTMGVAMESSLYARNYAKTIQQLLTSVLTKTYKEPPPRDNNKGGNRNYGN